MNSMFNQIMLNIKRGYYRYIGSGSSRDVFDLRNGYVIKVAKNRAGIAQNKSEYNISYYDNSSLFAKVVAVSNNFNLLIMEKADKIYNISYVWKYFNVKDKKGAFGLEQLSDILRHYNLLLNDLKKESSWGMINGRFVIIDYGFTREVHTRYYKSF
ncbi:UNVERIFIED_ORG: hypothetical protein B2H98_01485 [Clostridium botulinum]|uniref:hypothetical protein n=1 Tax=Clostridium TaxID=1485 RepID=UPI000A1723C0|nr:MULTISPECIES: hypothetical protein [Clostridium]MBY6810888.1 hypothetical protein [Clostridium botulinum]MBY6824356.1 hypothetical protein [Clostridium botulinum]MBY6834810.1 hypothetical protein [Clostridium botulinum]MBY6973145.1 hypothetical protein [Clostridium botulinum]MCS6133173.1 hypothetical protein [Clostridium botulinum]